MFELDGTFDKAVGDQAMAFFGVPFRPEDHAQRAVTAALWIVKTLEDMIDDDESLRVGGGVGNGEVAGSFAKLLLRSKANLSATRSEF